MQTVFNMESMKEPQMALMMNEWGRGALVLLLPTSRLALLPDSFRNCLGYILSSQMQWVTCTQHYGIGYSWLRRMWALLQKSRIYWNINHCLVILGNLESHRMLQPSSGHIQGRTFFFCSCYKEAVESLGYTPSGPWVWKSFPMQRKHQ